MDSVCPTLGRPGLHGGCYDSAELGSPSTLGAVLGAGDYVCSLCVPGWALPRGGRLEPRNIISLLLQPETRLGRGTEQMSVLRAQGPWRAASVL